MTQVALGALLAAAIALLSLRARTLTRGGAIAAFAVGTIVFGCAGWRGALVLFAFFIPSAVLSRVGGARKRDLRDAGKQGPRDAWQVLANGGVAALCALLAVRFGTPLWAAFAGAFAAASADTWGTEIGTLMRARPVSILTLRPVPTGLSGGVTLGGSIATLGGALCVAAVAWACGVAPLRAVFAGGVAGAIADSLLGATVQALRWCPRCERACEIDPHGCGTRTLLRRGIAWIQNDAVNAAATAAGAFIALALSV